MKWLVPRRLEWALLAGVMLLALVILLPMRLALGWLALDEAGISAREVEGSIWAGTIRDMRIGALPLGTLDVGLSPLPLVIGQKRLHFSRHAKNAADLHGAILIAGDGIGVDDLTGSLSAGGLFAPLPIAELDLDDVSIRFRDGQCARADGRVRALLNGALPGLALSQGLAGPVTCDGARAHVSLAGQSGRERIELSVGAKGNYAAEALVAEPDPALAAVLIASGFTRVPGGYRLRAAGRAR